LLCINCCAQEPADVKFSSFKDSIEALLRITKTDTGKLRVYFSACSGLQKVHKYKEELEYAYRAIAFADSVKRGSNTYTSKIRLLMSSIFNDQVTDLAEAIKQETIVEKIADSLKDSSLLARVLASIGLTEAYLEKSDTTSFRYYSMSLNISRLTHNTEQLVRALSLLGNLYMYRKDRENEIKCYRECIALSLANHKYYTAIAPYNNLGQTFKDMGMKDSAIIYFRNTEYMAGKANDKIGVAVALENIGNMYLEHKNTFQAGIDTLLLAAKYSMEGNNPHYSRAVASELYKLYKEHSD
jgi:tetratricopeptide (TPR) repeat protein